MTQEPSKENLTEKTLVYRIPGMTRVAVRRDVVYRRENEELVLDVYAPPDTPPHPPAPAVVLVAGFPDPGFEARVGCRFKDMGASTSWARLVAASGLAAITYTNREPAVDARAVIDHLAAQGEELGIDPERLGLWASSGNAPTALSLLMEGASTVKAAVLSCGFLLDLDGRTGVTEAARQWGFANPCARRSMNDLAECPLFLVRAGQDAFPGLNTSIDGFVARGLERNLPLTLVNYARGHHAFELVDDTDASRTILKCAIDFLRREL